MRTAQNPALARSRIQIQPKYRGSLFTLFLPCGMRSLIAVTSIFYKDIEKIRAKIAGKSQRIEEAIEKLSGCEILLTVISMAWVVSTYLYLSTYYFMKELAQPFQNSRKPTL